MKLVNIRNETLEVYKAEPYRPNELGSFGKASCMLLRQFNFPNTYNLHMDLLIQIDHDRCMSLDYEHASQCFKKHTGTGEGGLADWLKEASDEAVIEFLKDILRAEPEVKWTGYRIMGGVNRSNGYPVWTLNLFAKHPDSETVVYTGPSAPNVLPGPRYQ